MSESYESNIPTYSKGRTLATLTGQGDWETWHYKGEAYFRRNKTWQCIEHARPTSKILVAKGAEELQREESRRWRDDNEARAAHEADPNVGYIPTPDDWEPEPTRVERDGELTSRQLRWDSANSTLWSDIVEATNGEAASVTRQAPTNDGRAAYNLLKQRFNSKSVTTQFMLLKTILEFKYEHGQIETHVVTWENMVRRLGDLSIKLGPELEIVVFLRTLPASYKQYTTHVMMRTETAPPAQVYHECIEFSRTHALTSDEADTTATALWANQSAPRACKFGENCRDHQRGRCNYSHANNGSNRGKGSGKGGGKGKGKGGGGKGSNNGQGKGGSDGSWTCKSCQRLIYKATAQECRFCRAPRDNGASNNRPNAREQAHAAEIKQLHGQMHAAVEKCASEGADFTLDFAYPAIERPNHQLTRTCDQAFGAVETEGVTTFKFDSGASSHFVTDRVPLTKKRACNVLVETAGDHDIHVKHQGEFTSTLLTFDAKQCGEFSRNLFSAFQAARDGWRTVLDWEDSYIQHKRSGVKIHLNRTAHGWDLELRHSHAHDATEQEVTHSLP
jgi:hypothetical protein